MVGASRGYPTVIVIPETQSPGKNSTCCARWARKSSRCPRSRSPILATTIARPNAGAGKWLVLGESIQQSRQPRRPLQNHRPGDLGANLRQGHGFCRLGRHRAARWPARRLFLKERNPKIGVCADPYGAGMWSWFKHRKSGDQGRRFLCRRHWLGAGDENLKTFRSTKPIAFPIRRR